MAYIQQLLKGLIDPILLSVINELPTYGYQIVKELEQKTEGYLRLKAGTVYPALIRLEKRDCLLPGGNRPPSGRVEGITR